MKAISFLIAFGIFNLSVVAQDAGVLRKKHFNLESGIAIKGYDPVAYFTQNKAVKGKKELAVSHQAIVYYFSSPENKELFKAAPYKYEPEYGGWCAYAMGQNGEKISVDPETFKTTEEVIVPSGPCPNVGLCFNVTRNDDAGQRLANLDRRVSKRLSTISDTSLLNPI